MNLFKKNDYEKDSDYEKALKRIRMIKDEIATQPWDCYDNEYMKKSLLGFCGPVIMERNIKSIKIDVGIWKAWILNYELITTINSSGFSIDLNADRFLKDIWNKCFRYVLDNCLIPFTFKYGNVGTALDENTFYTVMIYSISVLYTLIYNLTEEEEVKLRNTCSREWQILCGNVAILNV